MDGEEVEQGFRVAALRYPPEHVARHFGEHVGQFYDRARYDELANIVRDTYARHSTFEASEFVLRLDRHIQERGYPPISWTPQPGVERPPSVRNVAARAGLTPTYA